MTPQALSVDVQSLVDCGTELFEDALTYHASISFIQEVGAIPDQAWGELPWSKHWRTDWAKAVGYRVQEATKVRDEVGKQASALLQVASDYANTDVDLAKTFKFDFLTPNDGPPIVPPSMQWYLSKTGTPPLPTYRPHGTGGQPAYQPFQRRPPGVPGAYPEQPTNIDGLRDLVTERFPQLDTSRHTATLRHGIPLFDTGPSHDNLDAFVQRYGYDLLCAECFAEQYGDFDRSQSPMSNFIVPAWQTVPSIIANRASLLNTVAKMYQDLVTNAAKEAKAAHRHWSSPGAAAAWYLYSRDTNSYITQISAEVAALASHGTATAKLIEGLRNAFADLAGQEVKRIIELHQAAVDAITEQTNVFGAWKADPVKALTSALKSLDKVLSLQQRQQVERAQDLIKIYEQERRERDSYDLNLHGPTGFSPNQVDGSSWMTDRWEPKESSGPVE